ncbi:MAG: HD domain-containing protein [Candidatus Neomarinimicrobiota bacterium]
MMANIKNMLDSEGEVKRILKIISNLSSQENLSVFVVGGVVRDLFMGRKLKEIDLMVVGDAIEFSRNLAHILGVKKIVPFPKFATAKIPYKIMPIEITSARTEKYESHSRKPAEVQFTDLKGDLIRRDFTVNAMAMSLNPDQFGELHDPFGGLKDLQKRRLITPLDPDETFSEDPLRMMRAAYFAAALNFEIEEKCLQSIKRQWNRIKIVSAERITAELTKILSTDKPSIGLKILQETGLMKIVFPEIHAMFGLGQTNEWHHKDIFDHTLQVVDNAAVLSGKMELRFAALVHDIAKPVTRRIDSKKGYTFHGHDAVGERMLNKVARRMKLSNELRDYLKKLTVLHLRPITLAQEEITDSAIRRVMVAAGDLSEDLLTLCRADITTKNPHKVEKYLGNFGRVEKRILNVKERDAFKKFQSPVRGGEIMKICGLKEGKLVGRLKSALEEAILDGKIKNEYAAAHSYLMEIKDDFLNAEKKFKQINN